MRVVGFSQRRKIVIHRFTTCENNNCEYLFGVVRDGRVLLTLLPVRALYDRFIRVRYAHIIPTLAGRVLVGQTSKGLQKDRDYSFIPAPP